MSFLPKLIYKVIYLNKIVVEFFGGSFDWFHGFPMFLWRDNDVRVDRKIMAERGQRGGPNLTQMLKYTIE